MTTWIALFILALAAMLLVSNEFGMIAGLDSDSFGYVALLLALAVFVGGGLLGSYRGRIGSMTRDAVTWLALGLGLVTIYAYKDELMPIAARVVGELSARQRHDRRAEHGGRDRGPHPEAARRAFHRHDQGERQVDSR